jgi:putative NADPH-quinone reductase
MKITLVLAHPDPSSFNHAIAVAVTEALSAAGHDVSMHDLHAEGFNPVMPAAEIASVCELPSCIESWCDEIASAEGIVIVHPNWWGQPPAILKGWIDRVVRPGVAYRFLESDGGEGVPVGLLQARTALVFNTANTPEAREEAVFGDPLQRTWSDCVFGLCGITDVRRRIFGVVVTSSYETRQKWLEEARLMALEAFGSGS